MDGFSMNSFSANGSQYAPRSYSGNSESARAVGTWKCPVCDSRNPIRRPDCLSCSGGTSSENKPRVSGQSRLSYTHPHAHPAVDSRVEHARPNGVEHDQPTTDDILNGATSVNHPPRLQVREPGLAMSRWAPPGYVRGHNYNNNWVKMMNDTTSLGGTSTARFRPNSPWTAPPTPPDLGLPYEVQHYILTTVQRILEEGCFAFASRWAEKAIYNKNWTCPEQVELKTWRDELHNLIPPEAIIPELRVYLASALRDAVIIRNAATHRQRCTNFEIKKFTLQATKLMEIFDDITRQSKFHRLWTAIDDWDRHPMSADDKRVKLELALQEIGERPVNDMDWSPNVLSLLDVAARDDRPQSNDMEDPMDVD